MKSPLVEKSFEFAKSIVSFFTTVSKSGKDLTLAKQLLRSGTSIGANINEAIYGVSKADFVAKMHIAIKETSESLYWISLFEATGLYDFRFDELSALGKEIISMLRATIKSAKE